MTPEEFYAVLAAMPEPAPVEHRLYFDDSGRVNFYTMEDLPGNWILVDPLTYAMARHDIIVIDGTILELPKESAVKKLRPAKSGITCHPNDICLVVDPDQPHRPWSL